MSAVAARPRAAPGAQDAPTGRLGAALPLAAAAASAVALWLVSRRGIHHISVDGLADTAQVALRAIGAGVLLFGLTGFGVVRLFLPEDLRRHELLWVLPVGACALALLMTLLGSVRVPFAVALALSVGGGAALSAVALHRRGPPPRPTAAAGLSAYVAALVAAVALLPFFAAGFPTVIGVGSDAHLASGTAEFLRHNHPTAVDPTLPVDRVPLVWRSKPPIYYALGAVATFSGLETWEAIAPLAALMLALAAAGVFLLARELLAAGVLTAVAAMGAASLDRMVLHTVMHPYFNQTWGYFTLPFALVLGWWAVRRRSRSAAALMCLFLGIGAFAYPLALPIPLVALAVFYALDVRERRRRGEPGPGPALRRLFRGRRSLLWIVPLTALLAIPLWGVAEKTWDAAVLLVDPNASLRGWIGDLVDYVPAHQFFALASPTLWWLALAAMLALAGLALSRLPRPLALGLGLVMLGFLLAGAWFRQRDYGWYFEFKTLAFVGPLVVAAACVGTGHLRRCGPPLLVALLVSAAFSAKHELQSTEHQLPEEIIALRSFDAALPETASVRLDMRPNEQIWVAYMLAGQPLCSRLPLLGTSYPHVQFSRRADFILVDRTTAIPRGRPLDASGPPLRRNRRFALYRAKPSLPGPDACSRRMVQTVEKI